VRPENNNDTVSEGIGYGMLSAVLATDRSTFDGLWRYAQKYLDSNGLMNWQIGSDGRVIGSGSAADADEDIAYSLYLASQKWGSTYTNDAIKYITSMLAHDVSPVNNLTPGDGWGATPIVNPSYLSPNFYRAFARLTGVSRWNLVADHASSWLLSLSNASTGLLPDWINEDKTSANISFDANKNDFYYDATRAPIRALFNYKTDHDANSYTILKRQSDFLNRIGISNLRSGYTMSGAPITGYLDTTFLTSYTAAAQIDPTSDFGKNMLAKLINTPPTSYFGTSLRTLLLLIISN